MNPLAARLGPALVAPTAMPPGTAPDSDGADTFDAALMRELGAGYSPDETATTSPAMLADCVALTFTEGSGVDAGMAPDEAQEAQISPELQALIASLTLLAPQKINHTAPPAPQGPHAAVDTAALVTATTKPDQPVNVLAETAERPVIATTSLDRDHHSPRLETALPGTARSRPEKLSVSAPAIATDIHAAPVQGASVFVTAPVTAPFTLQETTAAPSLYLAPRVGNPGWDQALGQRVLWLAGSGHQQATLTINPPQLGPVQVTLQIQDNQAIASFVSAQPEVRQALEAAMPRLRDMLNEAGLQLSQAHVHAESNPHPGPHERGGNQQRQAATSNPGVTDAHSGVGQEIGPASALMSGHGLVDIFV